METHNFVFVVCLIIGLFVLGLIFAGTDEGSFREVTAALEAEVHGVSIN